MSAPLPTGFKTREEYNEYMKKYNKGYRERKKNEIGHTLELFSELVKHLKETDEAGYSSGGYAFVARDGRLIPVKEFIQECETSLDRTKLKEKKE